MVWVPLTLEEKKKKAISEKCAKGGRMKKGRLGPIRTALNAAFRKLYGENRWRYGGKQIHPKRRGWRDYDDEDTGQEAQETTWRTVTTLFKLARGGAEKAIKHRRMDTDEHRVYLAMRRHGIRVLAADLNEVTLDLKGERKVMKVKPLVDGFWQYLEREVDTKKEIKKLLRWQEWTLRHDYPERVSGEVSPK